MLGSVFAPSTWGAQAACARRHFRARVRMFVLLWALRVLWCALTHSSFLIKFSKPGFKLHAVYAVYAVSLPQVQSQNWTADQEQCMQASPHAEPRRLGARLSDDATRSNRGELYYT